MEFDADKLEPTYKFLSGVPGNSYAFALARNIGLPPRVMAKAEEYLGDKHAALEESIEVIQRHRREAERARRETEEAKRRADERKAEYEKKFNAFKGKYNELIRLAKEEAAQIVASANKLVENTIREAREAAKEELEIAKRALEQSVALREQAASEQTPPAAKPVAPAKTSAKTLAEVRKEFEAEKQKIQAAAEQSRRRAAAPDEESSAQELQEGDAVTMEDFATTGVIVAIDRESSSAVVEFDAVKFRTGLQSLRRASAKEQKRAKAQTSSSVSSVGVNFDAKTEIDLRGMYADEAIKTVEEAIAAALTGNVHSLRIIHGKGTGALRQAVQQHLQHHPAVAQYRNGLLTEGGAGVTVAELK
jgi:DNA mismatch repair protein MutS2